MAETRTIDNLGSDVSVSYAIAQQRGLQDPDLSIDPSPFRAAAEITVTSPYFSNEFDEMLNTSSKHASWAGFTPPDNFEGNRKTKLFSLEGLIPSIGTIEHQETIKEKVMNFQLKKIAQKGTHNQKEIQQDQKESQKILDLINELIDTGKILNFISAKRGEFQKG